MNHADCKKEIYFTDRGLWAVDYAVCVPHGVYFWRRALYPLVDGQHWSPLRVGAWKLWDPKHCKHERVTCNESTREFFPREVAPGWFKKRLGVFYASGACPQCRRRDLVLQTPSQCVEGFNMPTSWTVVK